MITIIEDGVQDRIQIGDGGDVDLLVKGLNDDSLLHTVGSSDFVGIGTSFPSKKLTVTGDISASGHVHLTNTKKIYLKTNDTSDNYIQYGHIGDHIHLKSQDVMLDVANGVGIGIGSTANPTKTLTVGGDISASGAFYGYQMVAHPIGQTIAGAGSNWFGFGPTDDTFIEDSDTDFPRNRIMVPFDGYVHSVRIRTQQSSTSNCTLFVAKIANGTDADTLDTAGASYGSEVVSINAAHTMFTFDEDFGTSATFNAGDVLGVKAAFTAAPGDVEGALVLMYKVT